MTDVSNYLQLEALVLGEFSPTAWIYEVCYRKDAQGNTCPQDARTSSEYGGVRLQLNPGDHLKIRFINQLPPAPPDAEHLGDADGALLIGNPTNIHTHGLIVEPRQPSANNPTYGDYIYVLAYPQGKLPMMAMPGLDMTDQPLDYDVYIPRNHPSGSFWVHPHVHGLALNQMSYGLAGLISVGAAGDYVTGPSAHMGRDLDATVPVRNILMKDMQVQPDGSVLSQEDPQFCSPDPVDEPSRDGFCSGQAYMDDTGVHSYVGGKWFFTLNGQVHPTIHTGTQGEIWRITQASGSRTYQLALQKLRHRQATCVPGACGGRHHARLYRGLRRGNAGNRRQGQAGAMPGVAGQSRQRGVHRRASHDAGGSSRNLDSAAGGACLRRTGEHSLRHGSCRRSVAGHAAGPGRVLGRSYRIDGIGCEVAAGTVGRGAAFFCCDYRRR
jgi:hypothetical protein